MFIEQADAIDKGELNMTIYSKYNEVRNAYLSSLKMITQSVATYDKYETVLNDFGKFLEQNCGKVEQTDISPLMVLNYKEEATKRGIKRNTLRHYLIILRSFFKWCVEHKFYAAQPIFESDIPKSERIEYNLLTEQQIETILRGEIPKWSKMATAKRNRALVILLIQSGLRVSELINLRIKDLDFEQHTIRVSHGKGDKLRLLPFRLSLNSLSRNILTSVLTAIMTAKMSICLLMKMASHLLGKILRKLSALT